MWPPRIRILYGFSAYAHPMYVYVHSLRLVPHIKLGIGGMCLNTYNDQ